jgi:hypothetical protein
VSCVTSIAKRKLQQSHNRRGAMWCMVNKHVGGDIGWPYNAWVTSPTHRSKIAKYRTPSRLWFLFLFHSYCNFIYAC